MGKAISIRKRIALELFRQLRKEKVREHRMRVLFWECTLRCNLSCRHCGSDCRVDAARPDMPAADFLKVVDGIAPHVEPGKAMVIFTGGEALVRPDVEACGLELYRRGFPWGIVSNGMLLSRRRLDSLLSAGMHSVTISLDGFEGAHNWLRRNPHSYAKALAAADMLVLEKEIVWDIVTCVNRTNLADLPAFRDFLIARGVARWRLFTIFPVGRASTFPELQLSNEEFTSMLNFIRETRKEGKIHLNYGCEGFLGDYEGEVRDGFYRCNAGISVASVLADGSISACPSIRANYRQGNIYSDNFIDVWETGFGIYRDRSWMRRGLCADCKMFRYCEGNGMHLRDDNGQLLVCHYRRIVG